METYPSNIEWNGGKVTKWRITSAEPKEMKIRINGQAKAVRSEKI